MPMAFKFTRDTPNRGAAPNDAAAADAQNQTPSSAAAATAESMSTRSLE